MKRNIATLVAFLMMLTAASAATDNTVTVVYNGTTATVTIASGLRNYVTDKSTGADVILVQSDKVDDSVGEITYTLSGTSSDGSFQLDGSYKATIELKGLTLTNPTGPALNIQNGKRVEISAKSGTTNTLTDGANDDYNGCIHSKGHLKFKGKGTLNVYGNSRHGIYSKEYTEVKNLTLNVKTAVKDGIHCKEYFYMEGDGTVVNIASAGDDGIQVELKSSYTGETSLHEDEDTGNFYQEEGTLTIGTVGGQTIKADGTINFIGGTQNVDKTKTLANGIAPVEARTAGGQSVTEYYRPDGSRVAAPRRGVYIVREGKSVRKVVIK